MLMTIDEWKAGQPERDAINAQHRLDMADPAYATAHWASVSAKIKGPSVGMITKSRAGEFETPLGPAALKTTAELFEAEERRKAYNKGNA